MKDNSMINFNQKKILNGHETKFKFLFGAKIRPYLKKRINELNKKYKWEGRIQILYNARHAIIHK